MVTKEKDDKYGARYLLKSARIEYKQCNVSRPQGNFGKTQ